MAAKSGRFTVAEPDAWLASLQTASARGDYLFGIDDYIVVAAKEPNSMRNPQIRN
jgi:hypothetical protein